MNDIKQIRERLLHLEASINQLCLHFTQETGFVVDKIEFTSITQIRYHYGEYEEPDYSTKVIIDIHNYFSPDSKWRKLS